MGKILVADDQFGVRRLLFEIFQEDHEVETAEDGAEALRLLVSFKPDLILMDIEMPGMNGIEILKQIRALDRQVAVIMMTSSYGNPQNMKKAKDLGIIYYVDKPFDLFELRERVREILYSSGISPKDDY